MKLNTRVRYGMRALLDIACHGTQEPVRLRDVAKRQGISEQYLEQLILPLKGAGIVRSMRGARGGFTLGKDPSEIKVSAVFEALGGAVSLTDCLTDSMVCSRTEDCVTRELWREINTAIKDVLASKTLQDILERELRRNQQPERAG